jgi:hypothetical protein
VRQQLRGNAAKFIWNADDIESGGKNDDIPSLIEQLIASGAFTSADKTGLQAMRPDAIRAIAEKFSDEEVAEEEIEEVVTKMNCSCHDEDYSDFIHAGRPIALRRELPEVRAMRNARIGIAQNRRLVANAVSDPIALGMLPPSSRRAPK